MAVTPNRAIEILRRVVLGAGLAAAAWLAFLTDLRPSISVLRDVPVADEALPRSDDALISQPREVAPVPRIDVAGTEWDAFFADVQAGFDSNDQGRRLYVDADEPPLSSLAARLTDFEAVDLVLAGGVVKALRIERAPAHEFVEFFDVNPLPMRLKYRWRHVAWWPLAGALVLYVALPWFRPGPTQLAYQRWRIVLGDFASSLMWGVFFLLPLGVIGGSVEAVTRAPIVVAIPWGLALLGLYSYYWVARHASYLLALRDNGCELYTLGGHESIAWGDLRTIEGVQITPPRWFVRLNFLAVLFGGSRAARLGQAGRALIIAGSRVNGLRLTGRDGSIRHVWVSDQMGGQAMTNIDKLMDAVARAGVKQPKAVVQLQVLFPPA